MSIKQEEGSSRAWLEHDISGEKAWLPSPPGQQWCLWFSPDGYGYIQSGNHVQWISSDEKEKSILKQQVFQRGDRYFIRDIITGTTIWYDELCMQFNFHHSELLVNDNIKKFQLFELKIPKDSATIFLDLHSMQEWLFPASKVKGHRLLGSTMQWLPKTLEKEGVPTSHLRKGSRTSTPASSRPIDMDKDRFLPQACISIKGFIVYLAHVSINMHGNIEWFSMIFKSFVKKVLVGLGEFAYSFKHNEREYDVVMTDVEVHMSSIKLIKGGREATSFARHLQQDASEKELALVSQLA